MARRASVIERGQKLPVQGIEADFQSAATDCLFCKGFNTRAKTWLKRLWKEDRGGEVLEYALIAGLIVVAAIAAITAVASAVLGC